MRRMAVVALDMPPGATVWELEQYLLHAIRSYCGGMDPEEAMFDLDKESVDVQLIKKQLPRRIKKP